MGAIKLISHSGLGDARWIISAENLQGMTHLPFGAAIVMISLLPFPHYSFINMTHLIFVFFFLEPQFWGQPFYLLSLCQHLNISWRLCPTLEPHWSELNTCQFDTRLPLSWRRQHRWFRWSLSRLFSVSSSDIGKTFLICFPWTRRHNEDESFFFIKWYQTHLIMFHYRVFLWLVSICAVIWRGM